MRSFVIPLLFSFALYHILCCCFITIADATILAKSDIEKCARARVREDIRCGHKIIVELAIAAGQHADEDAILATLDAVRNASSGEIQTLRDPQTIKISKSIVYMGYPLQFQRSFNRRIHELGKGIDKCRAHKCQTYDDRGRENRVENAGFCCDCVGFKESHHRGMRPKCKLFLQTGLKLFTYPYGTQHCLGFDSQWFPTYAISEGQMEFTITIEVFIGYDKLLSKLTLSPGFLATSTPDKSVIASLHGDLLSYSQIPEFPTVYLSRPPKNAAFNRSEWLLIDKYKYSFDGAVCDLIGTSYYAFFHQVARCTQPFNNCLRFQLQDYIEEDSARIRKGMRPRYGMTQYGEFNYAEERASDRFLLPLQMVTKSIITLELNADNVKFVINRSPGKILSVKVPKFEALSRDGLARVVVSNIGELVAGYFLAMNCSSGVKSSPEMIITLHPNNPKTMNFSLVTTNDKSANVECIARLRDSGGEIVDRASTMVSVTATTYINVSRFGKQDTDPEFEERGFVGNVVFKLKSLLKGGIQRILGLGKGMFGSSFGTFFSIVGSLFGGRLSILSSHDSSCSDCGIVSFTCIVSNLCYGKGAILLGAIVCVIGLTMCGLTKGSFSFSKLEVHDRRKHDHNGKHKKKQKKKDTNKKEPNKKETTPQENGYVWNQTPMGFPMANNSNYFY